MPTMMYLYVDDLQQYFKMKSDPIHTDYNMKKDYFKVSTI